MSVPPVRAAGVRVQLGGAALEFDELPDATTRQFLEDEMCSLCFFHFASDTESAPTTVDGVHEDLQGVWFWRLSHI